MKNGIKYKNPWHKTDQDLNKQLQLEIASNHVLANTNVRTIARRDDNDDVLYKLTDEDSTYAIVHLTWKQSRHTDPKWPKTKIFNNLGEIQKQINDDNLDWE